MPRSDDRQASVAKYGSPFGNERHKTPTADRRLTTDTYYPYAGEARWRGALLAKEGILDTHTPYASLAGPVDDQQYLDSSMHQVEGLARYI